MYLAGDRPRLTAVLGPTNTGKTHLAIERMLGHASGMIGFPLRLLARENYDRIVAIKGRAHVALVTGEEKIVPPGARWFLCTVESMPLDRPVAFLGIDEIQLCADPERGHVFTDRLLHARGHAETMVMGAETIRPLIRKLVPEAEFVSRPRFSELTYTGMRKLTRLPPRSAIVVFSANDVYEIAELMRRQRGGTAVVLGALSPAHPQRPGRAVPVGRGRLPGGDRRHRHGAEHGHRPCRLRPADQVRRPLPAPAARHRDRPDRRPRRAAHDQRHLRHHRRGRHPGRGAGRRGREPPLRPAADGDVAQRRARLPQRARPAAQPGAAADRGRSCGACPRPTTSCRSAC